MKDEGYAQPREFRWERRKPNGGGGAGGMKNGCADRDSINRR